MLGLYKIMKFEISLNFIELILKGIHQTIQKNSVGFIPWDGITVGKDRIP